MNQTIIGDRWSGWPDIDTNNKSEYVACQCQRYNIAGASAVGRLHASMERPRDDAFQIRVYDEWIVAAVADGVGSREWSRYGATCAVAVWCESVLNAVLLKYMREPTPNRSQVSNHPSAAEDCGDKSEGSDIHSDVSSSGCGIPIDIQQGSETLIRDMITQAFRETRRNLEQLAQSRQIHIHDISCTLLGLLFNTHTGLIAVGQIGDGLIAGLWNSKDPGVQILVDAPIPGAANEVYTIAHKNWEKYLAINILLPQEKNLVDALYLMTDGVADDYFPPKDLLERLLRAIEDELRKQSKQTTLSEAANRLLHWLATYKAKGSWDDRTLVVVFRRSDD